MDERSIQQLLGGAVIVTILGMVVSAAIFPSVTVSQERLRLLVGLAGALLGLNRLRSLAVEYGSDSGRDLTISWGGDEK
jgi:hypothetical protein